MFESADEGGPMTIKHVLRACFAAGVRVCCKGGGSSAFAGCTLLMRGSDNVVHVHNVSC
jgi:hypothetical protein